RRDKRTPRGIVPLIRLHELEDDLDLSLLQPLAVTYGEVAADRRAPAEVRSLARYYLADFERSRGNSQHTEENLDAPGSLSGWLGTSGATKVWVNDRLALADPSYHPARFDQQGVAVTLHKGPNKLLLKICHADGVLGFYARFAGSNGEALALGTIGVPPLPPLP